MKDLVITGQRVKLELTIWVGCFVFVNLVNVAAIVKYGTSWSEMYSQLHVVIALATVFYLFVFMARAALNVVRSY